MTVECSKDIVQNTTPLDQRRLLPSPKKKKNIFQHEVYLAIAGCLLDRSEGIDDAH